MITEEKLEEGSLHSVMHIGMATTSKLEITTQTENFKYGSQITDLSNIQIQIIDVCIL